MEKIELLDMAEIAFMFRNDLHVIHHNLRGLDFKDTHETFGEYYDKALTDFDYFIEHAILKEEIDAAPNMTTILMNPNESSIAFWEPVEGNQPLSVKKGYEHFIRIGEDYLEALEMCRDYCDKKGWDNICSDIDQMHSEWDIEIQYKAKQTIG